MTGTAGKQSNVVSFMQVLPCWAGREVCAGSVQGPVSPGGLWSKG